VEVRRDRPSTVILTADTGGHRSILVRERDWRVRVSETESHGATARLRGANAMANREGMPVPERGLVLTHFLTVRDVARSSRFYAEVFGGQVVLAENPGIVKVANSWIIMNPGGGPTRDKPDVSLAPPEPATRCRRS
jgi:hypothetical protein